MVLPCEVDPANCGRIYVITWTKHIGDDKDIRVYLYSDTHSKPMGSLAGRAHFILHNNSNAEMHLRSLNVSDEGTYKCDVTYVQGKCPSLTFTKLHTLSKYCYIMYLLRLISMSNVKHRGQVILFLF